MGDDFTFEDAGMYFQYIDALIAALNADPQGRFDAFYSTPSDYVAAKIADTSVTLPVVTGDFFPYNDDAIGHNVWSGYFSSRPSFKAYVRESSALMQAARQLQLLAGNLSAGTGPGSALFRLERALGVTQHHDAIAGTAMQRVNDDYCAMLAIGRADAATSIAASLAAATNFTTAPFALCELANATLCPALEAASAPVVAVVYNALGQAAPAAPIRLSVGLPAGVASWSVEDSSGAPVIAQVVPLSARDRELRTLYGGSSNSVAWLCFVGELPAAGFAAFFLTPVPSAADAPHTHASVVRRLRAGGGASADDTVTNGRLTLTVSGTTGFVSRLQDSVTGADEPLSQQWLAYPAADGGALNGSTQASGAYILRPKVQVPSPIAAGAATVTVVSGPVLSFFESVLGYVSQESRLWYGSSSVEIAWTVGPVVVTDGGKEVVTRYAVAGLATDGQWTSDSNCRDAVPRRRNARRTNATIVEPVAMNVFPTTCLVRTSSPSVTLAVAVDRAQGSSSQMDGALELLVHRRLLADDGRGVGEPLDEPGVDGGGLIVRGCHWLVLSPAADAPPLYKAAQAQALSLPTALRAFAPLGGLSPTQWRAAHVARASLLAAPLRPELHLTTAHALNSSAVLLRISHVYEALEAPGSVENATAVALAGLLAGRTASGADEMTLPGSRRLADVEPRLYRADGGAEFATPVVPQPPAGVALNVSVATMQVRTFILHF